MSGLERSKPAPMDPLQAAMASRDNDMPTMVRTALAEGRMHLAFQPIVTSPDTSRIAFHEGFIRLMDEGGRVLPAAHFMPQVEETSLGRDLDCASLRLGLETLANNPGIRLAINMSARSIADGKWRRVLIRGLNSRSDIGERLILEISESSAMLLPEIVIRFMAEIQPKGVSFALDDFGAGQTSFRHLKDFLFDLVKIDRLFVSGIEQSPDTQVLAEALITVAHQFEMFAVAEGVETAQEAAHLARLGVDCMQGWHFGVPKPSL